MSFTYNNIVRVVSNAAEDINTEIADLNADNYILSAITFDAADNAFLFFTYSAYAAIFVIQPQKVNAVGSTQGDVDTDAAAEALNGYVPTGVFADPGTGQLFILYQQLNEVPEP